MGVESHVLVNPRHIFVPVQSRDQEHTSISLLNGILVTGQITKINLS